MKSTRLDKPADTFDVVPHEKRWEVKTPDGQIINSAPSQQAALEFAWIATMNGRPARTRLLTAEGLVKQEWDYPA